jgi:hypothetical protein
MGRNIDSQQTMTKRAVVTYRETLVLREPGILLILLSRQVGHLATGS